MGIEITNQRKYIAELLKQHEEFILIGLTGRVGSGCSEASEIFGSTYEELELPHESVGTDSLDPGVERAKGLESDARRDRRILLRYACHHWLRFDVIQVRTVIVSFLLSRIEQFCQEVVEARPDLGGKKHLPADFQKGLIERTSKTLETFANHDYSFSQVAVQSALVENLLWQSGESAKAEKLKQYCPFWDELSPQLTGNDAPIEIPNQVMKNFGELFRVLYSVADRPEHYQIRTPLLKAVDELLEILSAQIAFKWWKKHLDSYTDKKAVQEKLSQIGDFLMKRSMSGDADIPMFYEYMLVHNIVPALSNAIHEVIAQRDSSLFTELFQKYGNSIRRYGDVSFTGGKDIPAGQADRIGDNAFAIPRRINQFIKSFRHPFDRSYARPTRIVIDSIKSVLESTYLRERYSAFYLFAISADDRVREQRLINSHKKKLNIRDIRIIDWNEFSNHGAEIYRDYNDEAKRKLLDEDEKEFAKIVVGEQGGGHIVDSVRKEAYESGLQQFVLQDVGSAIQNADVFISNNHNSTAKNMELRWEIVRSVSLIMYPGLLLPTPIERCMQTAFVAKANSGCLSRQVGAVVTDAEYNILSVGWNDVPDCDISCARKNLLDIQKELDIPAYSKYELENKNFRRRLGQIFDQNLGNDRQRLGELLCGLPWSYCFKDIHRDDRQPMRSRAMHGEEKALTKVPEQVPGGCLFTTSSPCEMCSKNAKNHHIQKIYYIEQYPGISAEQYSESGYTCNRAQHILFTGAVGRAYIQMYTPIMPHKDALKFMGINYKLD